MDNVSTFPLRIIKRLLFICAFFVVASESQILCDQTYYLQRYKSGTVSCNYELNFHAVLWYFGTSETPFVRTDAWCRECPQGEFDINTNGSLLIKQVDLKHEGAYKISVIHASGTTSSAVIQISVIGQLADLTVEDCRRSSSELCKRQQPLEGYQQLICLAKYSIPPTSQLIWRALHENGFKPTDSFETDTFTASYEILSNDTCISILTYNPNKVSFQYLTCATTGSLSSEERNVSIAVKGNIDMTYYERKIKYIFSEYEEIFQCPLSTFSLGYMKLPDGTTHVYRNSKIFARHPSCDSIDDCHLTRNGPTSLKYITYKEEGWYTCISSNRNVSSVYEVNVVHVVLPKIPYTAIAGCEENVNNCTLSVPLSGELTCFLLGSKPAANLTFNISFTEKSDIVLSDEMLRVTPSDHGTNDSYLTTEFQFSSCDAAAMMTCFSAEDPFQQTIGVSEVLLVTDSSTCSKDGKLTIILSVVICAIIITIVIIISLYKYRRRRSTNKGSTEFTELNRLNDITVHERIQNAFQKIFGTTDEAIFELEDDQFQMMLEDLYESHPVISELASFLATRTVNTRMTPQNYCSLVEIGIEKEKLSIEETLKLLVEGYTLKQIDNEGLMVLSKPLLSERVENLDIFVQVILFSVERGVIDVAQSILILETSKDKITDGNVSLYVGELTRLFLLEKLQAKEYIDSIILAKNKEMILTECLKHQMQRWMEDNEVDLGGVLTTLLSHHDLEERDVADLLEELTKRKCETLTQEQYLQLFTIATEDREMMSLNLFKILDYMLVQNQITVDMYTTTCKNIITERKENFGNEYKENIESLEETKNISDCFVILLIFLVANKMRHRGDRREDYKIITHKCDSEISMEESINRLKFLTSEVEVKCAHLLREFNRLFIDSESTLFCYVDILKTAMVLSLIQKEFVIQQLQHCMEKSLHSSIKKRTLEKSKEVGLVTSDDVKELKGIIKEVKRAGQTV